MEKSEVKILRRIVGEGYNLKAQHGNQSWRDALEDAEQLRIDEKKKLKETQPNPKLYLESIIKEDVKYGMYIADHMTDPITAIGEGASYYN